MPNKKVIVLNNPNVFDIYGTYINNLNSSKKAVPFLESQFYRDESRNFRFNEVRKNIFTNLDIIDEFGKIKEANTEANTSADTVIQNKLAPGEERVVNEILRFQSQSFAKSTDILMNYNGVSYNNYLTNTTIAYCFYKSGQSYVMHMRSLYRDDVVSQGLYEPEYIYIDNETQKVTTFTDEYRVGMPKNRLFSLLDTYLDIKFEFKWMTSDEIIEKLDDIISSVGEVKLTMSQQNLMYLQECRERVLNYSKDPSSADEYFTINEDGKILFPDISFNQTYAYDDSVSLECDTLDLNNSFMSPKFSNFYCYTSFFTSVVDDILKGDDEIFIEVSLLRLLKYDLNNLLINSVYTDDGKFLIELYKLLENMKAQYMEKLSERYSDELYREIEFTISKLVTTIITKHGDNLELIRDVGLDTLPKPLQARFKDIGKADDFIAQETLLLALSAITNITFITLAFLPLMVIMSQPAAATTISLFVLFSVCMLRVSYNQYKNFSLSVSEKKHFMDDFIEPLRSSEVSPTIIKDKEAEILRASQDAKDELYNFLNIKK
jgi:hypothetical protein